MCTTTVDLLEGRITELEKLFYGLGHATDIENIKPENSVIDSLLHVNTLISSALSGREKANAVMKRLPELNNYLDPVVETMEIPIDAKLQVLLTMESEIRENSEQLKKMQSLMPVLETECIKDVPEMSKKLTDLSLTCLKLYEESEKLNAHVNEVLSKYNAVVYSISKSLITLDAAVGAAEIAAMPKKSLDD